MNYSVSKEIVSIPTTPRGGPLAVLKEIAQEARDAIDGGDVFLSEARIVTLDWKAKDSSKGGADDRRCLDAIAAILRLFDADKYPDESDIEETALEAIQACEGHRDWLPETRCSRSPGM